MQLKKVPEKSGPDQEVGEAVKHGRLEHRPCESQTTERDNDEAKGRRESKGVGEDGSARGASLVFKTIEEAEASPGFDLDDPLYIKNKE